MKVLALVFVSSLFLANQSFASGCLSVSFYNLDAVAKTAGAESCYFEKLEQISNPTSMSDRQYNYFAEKVNEYVMVMGVGPLDKAGFEFMFYPDVRKQLLAKDDARKVDFSYAQTFSCYQRDRTEKKVVSQIYAYGVVGLTGVCLYKDKQTW